MEIKNELQILQEVVNGALQRGVIQDLATVKAVIVSFESIDQKFLEQKAAIAQLRVAEQSETREAIAAKFLEPENSKEIATGISRNSQ